MAHDFAAKEPLKKRNFISACVTSSSLKKQIYCLLIKDVQSIDSKSIIIVFSLKI